MPEISKNGSTIIFRILPHYYEDIVTGRKQADVRLLENKWYDLVRHADYIKFVCGKKSLTVDIDELGVLEIQDGIIKRTLRAFFTDVSLATTGTGCRVYVIHFINAQED